MQVNNVWVWKHCFLMITMIFQVSLYVLSRPSMLSVFNQILVVMTSFDTIYLISSVAEFSFVETFGYTHPVYDQLFVYFLYPLHNIVLCCSIFSHVVLAFERYLAVCHPQLVYSQHARPSRAAKNMEMESNVNGGAANNTKAMDNNKKKQRRQKHQAQRSAAAESAVRKKVSHYSVLLFNTGVSLNVLNSYMKKKLFPEFLAFFNFYLEPFVFSVLKPRFTVKELCTLIKNLIIQSTSGMHTYYKWPSLCANVCM